MRFCRSEMTCGGLEEHGAVGKCRRIAPFKRLLDSLLQGHSIYNTNIRCRCLTKGKIVVLEEHGVEKIELFSLGGKGKKIFTPPSHRPCDASSME